MSVKLILQGGPFDGEEQLVLDLNTTPGYEMQFNIPNYQTFDASGNVVLTQGMVAVYAYQGPGPGPGSSDTWTSSSIYEFTGEFYVPQPPPLYPPGEGPPVLPPAPAVFMSGDTALTVDADDPLPGVQFIGIAGLQVVGITTSVGYATIAMVAETVMVILRQPWQNSVAMSATAQMTVTPGAQNAVSMSATSEMSVTPS